MEVAPGVHLVEGVRGCNVYLLTDDELVLIDTGLPGNGRRIASFIEGLGREPRELALIAITHGHIDHMGSLAELRAMTGAKVLAHRQEVTPTSEGAYVLRPHGRGSRGKLLRMLARFAPSKATSVDLLAEDAQVLPYLGGLRAIHTPGHTRGSMCLLLERGGVLFVGDTIINNVDRLSRPVSFGADRSELERSLLRLARLDFDLCCFGHGPPLKDARARIEKLATIHPRSPLYWRMARSWRLLLGRRRR